MSGSVHARKQTAGKPEGVHIRTKAASGGRGCRQVLNIDRKGINVGSPGSGRLTISCRSCDRWCRLVSVFSQKGGML